MLRESNTATDFRRGIWMARALFFALVMHMGSLWAAGMKSENSASDVSNIGFMKNPPKKLTEKFPMCDAFLKVKWIDKKKRIGYSHFDFYVHGKKRGQMTALVYVGRPYPRFKLDLYKYQHKGTLQDIFSFINDGEIVDQTFLTIRHKRKKITFFPAKLDFTLSDWRKNVCIPYPDEENNGVGVGPEDGKTPQPHLPFAAS